MKTYTLKACQKLMDQYLEKGGEVIELEEGSLGLGLVICEGEGLKTAIIREVFISAWSSGHKVRMYNKTPKKYEALKEQL